MAVKTGITEEEYLRTSFPGVDQEYRDGELIERAMPNYPHSKVQARIVHFFESLQESRGVPYDACPELRHRGRPGRYLIPDVSVFWPDPPHEDVPSTPPFIAIEIVSPDDRMSEVTAKLDEYLDWGVPHIWLVDPQNRTLSVHGASGLRRVAHFDVPHTDRRLTAADIFPSTPAA